MDEQKIVSYCGARMIFLTISILTGWLVHLRNLSEARRMIHLHDIIIFMCHHTGDGRYVHMMMSSNGNISGYCPFVRGIHRSPVNSPRKGKWRGALVFSLICVWTNDWANHRDAGDLRCRCAQYDVTVMTSRIYVYDLLTWLSNTYASPHLWWSRSNHVSAFMYVYVHTHMYLYEICGWLRIYMEVQ